MTHKNEESVAIFGVIGFLFFTFIVFLVLKIAKVVSWSWWWVTAPLWGLYVLVIAISTVLAIVLAVIKLKEKLKEKERTCVGQSSENE